MILCSDAKSHRPEPFFRAVEFRGDEVSEGVCETTFWRPSFQLHLSERAGYGSQVRSNLTLPKSVGP